jgi:putative FmdB family regulatory protein
VPIFEYRCSSCGHRFEKIQKSSGSRPAPCPKCGGAAKRLASAPAIQFKGTGWYITDYARKGKSHPETAKGGEQGGEGTKGGGDEKAGGETKGSREEKPGGEKEAKESKTATEDKSPAKPAAPTRGSRGKKRD